MGVDPITLSIGALALGAAGTGYSAYQQRKARKDADKRFKTQEAAAAQKVQEAKKAERTAERTAKKTAKKKNLAIEQGGRPSTFNTSMFGLSGAAPVKKKVLG